MGTTTILVFLGIAIGVIAAGMALLACAAAPAAFAQRVFGWLVVTGGFGVVGGIAGLQFTGRLGPAQLWFRAPTFYLAAALLLAGAQWWSRRPIAHPRARLIRFGLPALALLSLGLLAALLRLDGRSTPPAMLLPTMRAAAPKLSYIDTGGNLRQLSELRGNVVLVNFWATWCGPCRLEMPMLSNAQTEFRDRGLIVVYLSVEEPAVLDDFWRKHQFEGVQGRLAQAADYYRAGQIYPLSYLISRNGRVAQRWSGRPAETWLLDSIRAEL